MCDDEQVIGARFYLMERRRGVILRKELPAGFTPAMARRVCELTIDALAELHAIDFAAAGLGDFGKRPATSSARSRAGPSATPARRPTTSPPSPRWRRGSTRTAPADGAPALIHNDFKFDNLILDDELAHITGILDWEMATVGDPLMDFGTSLAYWVEAGDAQPLQVMRFGATTAPGMMTRAEVVARYAAASGRALDERSALFYYVYGLFKTSVVAQQIYYRFAKGLTHDARFAAFHRRRARARRASPARDRRRPRLTSSPTEDQCPARSPSPSRSWSRPPSRTPAARRTRSRSTRSTRPSRARPATTAEISGNGNTVSVDTAGAIDTPGNQNTVSWKHGLDGHDAAVSNLGNGNTVSQAR